MAAINDLASLTAPVAGDQLVIYDASATADRKIDAGLVPWTNTPSTFDAAITIAGSSPARVILSDYDLGAGAGPRVQIGRNSNASTPGAGSVQLFMNTGSSRFVWVDATGVARIGSSSPSNANDTGGVAVGSQTSSLDAKTLTGPGPDGAGALAHIAQGAAAVRRFTYKDGRYSGEEFSGLVVDFAPRYGMDRDEAHPAGRSLNVITALGDLMLAVSYLAGRVAELEARLNTAAA